MLAKYLHFIPFFRQQSRLIFFIHPESYFIILLLIECNLVRRKYCPKALLRQNLAITKSQGTGKICALSRGFVISRLFFIYFKITGVNKMARYTKDFVIRGSLHRAILKGVMTHSSVKILNISTSFVPDSYQVFYKLSSLKPSSWFIFRHILR